MLIFRKILKSLREALSLQECTSYRLFPYHINSSDRNVYTSKIHMILVFFSGETACIAAKKHREEEVVNYFEDNGYESTCRED